MTIRQRWFGLGLLVVFAIGLIFFKLGDVPHGMTWDEAAIGYNGYAVITTRRDEWLTRLPVSFKSYGDYKAPLAIYISGVFVKVLGSELWVVRLPFAIAGVMSVVGTVVLVQAVLIQAGYAQSRQSLTEQLIGPWSLVAGAIVLTSPWFLHFARTGFESGMALMWVIWGTWAAVQLSLGDEGLLGVIRRGKQGAELILAAVSAVCWVAALYTYHSAKVVVPVLVLTMAVLYRGKWLRYRLASAVAVVMMIGLSWPLVKDTIWGAGGTRMSQASFLGGEMGVLEKGSLLVTHILAHVSPAFLVGGWTDSLRHSDGQWGVFLAPVVIFVVLGMLLGWRGGTAKVRIWVLSAMWVVAGIGAAALGLDVPHSNRALLALPGFILFAIQGGLKAFAWLRALSVEKVALGSHGEKNLLSKSVVGTFVLVYGLLFVAYQYDYYHVFARESASEYKDGYLEAMRIAVQYEKGQGVPKADQIVFTSEYGQPYMYALFVRRTNPIWYQGGSLNTFLFTDTIQVSDLERNNTLVVAGEKSEVPKAEADHVISGSDGKPRFWIYFPERIDEK